MLFLPSIACSFVVHSVLESEVSAHARKPEVPIAVLPGTVLLLEFAVACDDAEECLEEPKWECEVVAVEETSFGDRCFVLHSHHQIPCHHIQNISLA